MKRIVCLFIAIALLCSGCGILLEADPAPPHREAMVRVETPAPAQEARPVQEARPAQGNKAEESEEAAGDERGSSSKFKPDPTPEPSATQEPVVELTEQLVLDTDGDSYMYLCEMYNPCDYAIKVSDVSVDLEDADGNLLSVTDYVTVFPKIIPPGGTGYISESVCSATYDTDVDFAAIAHAVLHYDLKQSTLNPLPVELVSATLGNKYGFPTVVGKVINNGEADLTFVSVAFPLFSADGVFQTIIHTYVDIEAGQEASFDTMAVSADYKVNYSGSVLGDPIFSPLF